MLVAFLVSGAAAGLGGVMYAARYGTVNSQAGLGFELDAVGAAVIGGVAIFGGSGTLWGAAFGGFLLSPSTAPYRSSGCRTSGSAPWSVC